MINLREQAEILRVNRDFYLANASQYDQGREHFYACDAVRTATDLDRITAGHSLKGMKIVDIGCGTGHLALVAAQRGGHDFHCVDLNEHFLEQTQAKLRNYNPNIDLNCYETDVENFVADYPEVLREADLVMMGALLQYVPNHLEIMHTMGTLCAGATVYITNTRIGKEGEQSLLESLLCAVDYRVYRHLHGFPTNGERETGTKVTVEVDRSSLSATMQELGFTIDTYTYTTFHTGLFNRLFRGVQKVLPQSGIYFTMVAHGGHPPIN